MKTPKVKICGITREEDARTCLVAGAQWIGINLYEPSPRSVSLLRAEELFKALPLGMRVLVDVAPGLDKLESCRLAGFDVFQLHFNLDLSAEIIRAWSELVGRKNLWLAPKLPPQEAFPVNLLEFSDTIVLDAYAKDAFGGTGRTGNWHLFKGLKLAHPDTNWVLAGGLKPDNLLEAVRSTGAEIVDLNSGIETGPGIKDPVLLQSAFDVLL